MPLAEALTFLEISEYERARDRLITAEAADRLAALPRLLLGLVLVQLGERDAGVRRIRDAILLNPFMVPVDASDLYSRSLQGPWVLNQSVHLPKAVRASGVIRSGIRSFVPKYFSFRSSSGSVLEAGRPTLALDGKSFILARWSIGDEARTYLLSRIDIPSGEFLWSVEVSRDEELCLVTPQLAVTRYVAGATHRMRIRWVDDPNRPVSDMDVDYFETVLCPGWSALKESQNYRMSHCAFERERTVIEREAFAVTPELGRWDLRRNRIGAALAAVVGFGKDTIMRELHHEAVLVSDGDDKLTVVTVRNSYRVAMVPMRPLLTVIVADAVVEWRNEVTD
jgi:hypothetical protein